MGYGAIIGGIIGAAGSIGGGLLSQQDSEGTAQDLIKESSERQILSAILPQLSPLTNAANFESLAALGIVDPGFLLRASPANQALDIVLRSPTGNKLSFKALNSFNRLVQRAIELGDVDAAIAQTPEGEFFTDIGNVFRAAGVSESIESLLQRELDYRQQIQPTIERYEALQGEALESRATLAERLAGLASSVPGATGEDFAALRDQELERRLRLIRESEEEIGGDILRQANAVGFNPGRALGELAERGSILRADSDLDALNAAIALIAGQQGIAGTEIAQLAALTDIGRNLPQQQLNLSGGATIGPLPSGQLGAGQLGAGVAGAPASGLLGSILGGDILSGSLGGGGGTSAPATVAPDAASGGGFFSLGF